MKAVKGEELIVIVEDKIGKLEEITEILRKESINIRAINAYIKDKKAVFRILTSNNTKTKELLKNIAEVKTEDVVIAEIPDEVGRLNELCLKLKEANININYLYGTASEPQATAIVVFSCNDNFKAVDLISSF